MTLIRRNILQKGGKAVDAIIASLLCEGVTMPHTLGIGGGFFMTIYEKSKNKASVIIARETAPAKSTVDMYHGDPNLSIKGENQSLSTIGRYLYQITHEIFSF